MAVAKKRRCFAGYIIAASILMILIVLLQSFRYRLFGTTLLLGWDSPAYVWSAKYMIVKGPMSMIEAWSFPYFYTSLLAFFGYLAGDVVVVERILPILFGILLIWANSELVLRITNKIHIAGLAAILSAISVNVLRILSDLHRNLMAFSLSMIALLLVPNLEERKSFIDRRYLSFIVLLFIIAITQFETFFILCFSLMVYGIFTRNLKKLFTLTFACAVPATILVSLFPSFFFAYLGTLVHFEYEITVSKTLTYIGGSWALLGFLIVGNFLFFKSELRNRKLISLIFSWSLVLLILISSVVTKVAPLPTDFADRSLLVLPIPVLLALAAQGCNNFISHHRWMQRSSSIKKRRPFRATFQRVLPLLIALFLIGSSGLLSIQSMDGFLTPFIPRSAYEKILEAKQLLAENFLSTPVFVFRGDPPVWYVGIYRNYLGAEIGEHFAYYGEIENLFRLLPSEPKIKYNAWLYYVEKYYTTFYFDELIGNITGPPPVMYVHDSHITSVEELMSHPIVLIAPEFYNEEIPYYLKSFHKGEGIYIIPPNSSINPSEITYGPEVTVIKNGTLTQVKSEYAYIDPYDPSIVYIKVNASSGYTSYNFTDFPSNWTFHRIEQDSDLGFPEMDPRRINGTKAYSGNDPADSLDYWISPVPEQDGTLQIDQLSKKEGFASLKVSGKTDSWGGLSVRYDSPGTWNLVGYSSIGVWAKCNESALFSITLVDNYGGSRTFWAMEAGGSSATSSWKRFAVNLTEYTSQTPDFRINSVDHINLLVYSTVGKNLSFWIDDLTVDTTLNLHSFVYKDRVPVDETVVAYFYTHMEDV
jgi:hypothetical protein